MLICRLLINFFQQINFVFDKKDDVIIDMEVEGIEDIFQVVEDMLVMLLNFYVMVVVDFQLFCKFFSRNQDDVRQIYNVIVFYFSMIFVMVSL